MCMVPGAARMFILGAVNRYIWDILGGHMGILGGT